MRSREFAVWRGAPGVSSYCSTLNIKEGPCGYHICGMRTIANRRGHINSWSSLGDEQNCGRLVASPLWRGPSSNRGLALDEQPLQPEWVTAQTE